MAHTASRLPTSNPAILQLLEIDIKSLFEITERLMLCYREQGSIHEFPGVLHQLRDAISDPRWHAKVVYLEALYLATYRSAASAWRLIEKCHLLAASQDPDLLAIALQVAPDSHSPEDRLRLADRIVASTAKSDEKLQYSAVKGIIKVTDLEDKGGVADIELALAEYEKISEAKRTLYGQWMLGRLYSTAARLGNRDDLAQKAIAHLQKCMGNTAYTNLARADMLSECGECYLQLGESDKARVCFETSLAEYDDSVVRIFLVRALVRLSEFSVAFSQLKKIDSTKLKPAGFLDFGIAWAELALVTQDAEHKSEALSILGKAVARGVFETYRRDLISELKQPKPPAKSPSMLRRIMTRYVLLQPNVIGFGVNLNAIIEDIFPSVQGNKTAGGNADPQPDTKQPEKAVRE